MKDFKLNNGQTVKLLEIDFWGRPVFSYTSPKNNNYNFCIVDNVMHTMAGDEPCSQLSNEWQLRDFNFSFFKGEFIKK